MIEAFTRSTTFGVGRLGVTDPDYGNWQVRCEVWQRQGDSQPCPHCVFIQPGHPRWGERQPSPQWLVPRAVVADFYRSPHETSICLDCILAAAGALK